MPAKGFNYLSEEQVKVLNGIEGGVTTKARKVLAKLLDNALSIVIGELPDNIPQTKIQNLVGDLAAKLAAADFTDEAVTDKLITGFVSGAGTLAATDSLLEAINKLDGNVSAKLDASKIAVYTSAADIGGSATPTFTVTGLAAGDTILSVVQKTAGANSLPLLGFGTHLADTLPGVYSADPGAGSVIVVTVLKA